MSNFRRNIRLARKSVFNDFRAYVWFFFAMLIIETLLSAVALSALNGGTASNAVNLSEYDYHLAIKNANEEQYLLVKNDRSVKYESSRFYDVVRAVRHGEDGDGNYDVYIGLRGDAVSSYSRFISYYSDALRQYNSKGNWYIFRSPLLTSQESGKVDYLYLALTLVAAAVFCGIFLRALYGIRTNYFRFSYGIFMTFGGGSGKIYSTSFWEMGIVALIAFIPSSVIAYSAMKIIYAATGFVFRSTFSAYLISLFTSFVISAFALRVPCKRVSRKMPVDNLTAADNSNYVTSPRVSFEFWKVNIPFKYGLTSFFRFRKYYAELILVCVLFSSLFIWTNQLSDLYLESLSTGAPDCVITFIERAPGKSDDNETEENGGEEKDDDNETGKDAPAEETIDYEQYYTPELDEAVSDIDELSYIHRVWSVTAPTVNSHAVVEPGMIDYRKYSARTPDGDIAFNNVEYCAASDKELSYFERFDHTGDLAAALSSEGQVIVCDTLYNEKQFNFSPGDKITIAEFDVQRRYVDPSLTDSALLERQLKAYDFRYKEYVIGAVIHDMPGTDNLKIFMQEDDLSELCGKDKIEYRNVEIGFDPELSGAASDVIEARIAKILEPYANASVKSTHNSASVNAELSHNRRAIILFAAVTALLAVPLIWIFSQRMFTDKRREELYALEYIGIGRRKIRGLMLLDALLSGGIALILISIVAPLGCKLIKLAANRFFSRGGTVRYASSVDPPILITALAVVLLTASVSFIVTYRSYTRGSGIKDKININTEFGE